MADEPEIIHVAATPLKTFDAELVNKAAAVIGKDPYTTRLLLTGKIPKIIANYQNTEEANSVARGLCALGLVAFACSDSELRRPFSSNFLVRSIIPDKAEATFFKKGDETCTLKAGDVFLILKGTRQIIEGEQSTTTTRKLNITATLLTGIPMFRKVKEKTGDAFKTEVFVRIYGPASSEPIIEIVQNDFDYSFLKDRLAPTSSQNLNKTADFLMETFPRSIFDDTLAAHSEATEVNCRLVYLYHKAREVC
jgi:hypothetical protein